MPGESRSSSGNRARHLGLALPSDRGGVRNCVLRAVCLAILWSSPVLEAGATNVLTERFGDPNEASSGWVGFEFEPRISLPLPIASSSRDVVGLSTGMGFTFMSGPKDGVGVDIAYHYWPVSSGMKQGLDDLLRQTTWNALRTGNGTWGMEVLQLGMHVRSAAPGVLRERAWLEMGVSLYRIDPNISGYSGDAGLFTVMAPPLGLTSHVGGSFTAGAELYGGPRVRVGLDATYHLVMCDDSYVKNLQVFTLGARSRFRW